MDYFLLDCAVGSIQPGPDQQDRLGELVERLAVGEFHVPTPDSVPSACIDGRGGSARLVPNAAGGSESLLVADDLTFKRLAYGTDGSTAAQYARLLGTLADADAPIGGHTDDHAAGVASGCGANDRLETIYLFIAENGQVLRDMAGALGITVPDDLHDLILENARVRNTFSTGAELLARLREGGGAVDDLHGTHREAAAVINTVAGTTLDRPALERAFPGYQAFNVDVWSFEAAARAIAHDGSDVPALLAAIVYYNLATAHVLCGPGMRVVVRR